MNGQDPEFKPPHWTDLLAEWIVILTLVAVVVLCFWMGC